MKTRWVGLFGLLLFLGLVAPVRGQVKITLDNQFIAACKDRVTIDTSFLVDKAHAKPNRPSKDGDLHVAGRSKDIGLPCVAELMNAKFEVEAMEAIHEHEGTDKPLRIAGAWHLWCEHAGGSDQVQGKPLEPCKTTNPDHVFEIHPITRVGQLSVLKLLRPIKGYIPKEAERAFHRYEHTRCAIRPGEKTTTLITSAVGFNYVEFILALHPDEKQGGKEVADGRLVFAEIRDLDDELLVRKVRTVFVKDSEPEKRLRKLQHGQILHVLGIPRISLALVSWRVNHAQEKEENQEVLTWNLPYEIIVVGVYTAVESSSAWERSVPGP